MVSLKWLLAFFLLAVLALVGCTSAGGQDTYIINKDINQTVIGGGGGGDVNSVVGLFGIDVNSNTGSVGVSADLTDLNAAFDTRYAPFGSTGGGSDLNTQVFAGSFIDVNGHNRDVLVSVSSDFNHSFVSWTDGNQTFVKQSDGNVWYNLVSDSNNVGRLDYAVIANPPSTVSGVSGIVAGTNIDVNSLNGDVLVSTSAGFDTVYARLGVASLVDFLINGDFNSLFPRTQDANLMYVKTSGNETVNGVKTFSSIPVLPSSNPTTDNQAVRKAYVDAVAQGLTWKNAIIDINLLAPPVSPNVGDSYICEGPCSGAWANQDQNILQWNGSAWINREGTKPVTGWAVLETDQTRQFVFSGTNWVQINAGQQYTAGTGLQLIGTEFSVNNIPWNSINTTGSLLSEIGDVTDVIPNNNDVLYWDAASNSWKAHAVSGSGGGGGSGSDRNTTYMVPIVSAPVLGQAWTNQPAALTELFGSTTSRVYVDLNYTTAFRIVANMTTGGTQAGSSRLWLQYSTNNSTFADANANSDGNIGLAGAGIEVGRWTPLVGGANNDVYLRLVGQSGNANMDPSFRELYIEFKRLDLAGTAGAISDTNCENQSAYCDNRFLRKGTDSILTAVLSADFNNLYVRQFDQNANFIKKADGNLYYARLNAPNTFSSDNIFNADLNVQGKLKVGTAKSTGMSNGDANISGNLSIGVQSDNFATGSINIGPRKITQGKSLSVWRSIAIGQDIPNSSTPGDVWAQNDLNAGANVIVGTARKTGMSAGDVNISGKYYGDGSSLTGISSGDVNGKDINPNILALGSATTKGLVSGDINADGNRFEAFLDLNIARKTYFSTSTTYTQDPPTNGTWDSVCDTGSVFGAGDSLEWHIYAYKTVNGTRIYSSTFTTASTTVTDDGFAQQFTFTTASGAEGYKVILLLNAVSQGGWDIGNAGGACDYGTNYGDATVTPTSLLVNVALLKGGDLNVGNRLVTLGATQQGMSAGDANIGGNLDVKGAVDVSQSATASQVIINGATTPMLQMYRASFNYPEIRLGEDATHYLSFLWSTPAGTFGRTGQITTVGGAYGLLLQGNNTLLQPTTGGVIIAGGSTTDFNILASTTGLRIHNKDLNIDNGKLFVGSGKAMQNGMSAGDANIAGVLKANDVNAANFVLVGDAKATGLAKGDLNATRTWDLNHASNLWLAAGGIVTGATINVAGLNFGDANIIGNLFVNKDVNFNLNGNAFNLKGLSTTASGSELALCIANAGGKLYVSKQTSCAVSALIVNAQNQVQTMALHGSYQVYQTTYSDFAYADGNPSSFTQVYYITPNLYELEFIDSIKITAMCLNAQGGVSEIDANMSIVGDEYKTQLVLNNDKNYLFMKQGDRLPIQATPDAGTLAKLNACTKWTPVLKSTGFYLRTDENIQEKYANVDLSYLNG